MPGIPEITVNGDTLTIRLKLGPPVPSSTGKTMIRFSTGGFQPIDGQDSMRVNLTVIELRGLTWRGASKFGAIVSLGGKLCYKGYR